MVENARAAARRMVTALRPFVERGIALVGLEPSCLLGLRDEFRALLPGAETAALAEAALTFEEFIVREQRAGRFAPPLREAPFKRVLVHGHCHQKAFNALGAEFAGRLVALHARAAAAGEHQSMNTRDVHFFFRVGR